APATGGSGVTGTGVVAPGARRHTRWSAQDENQTVSACVHQAPPPYSWTRVRADQPSGRGSVMVPSVARRTNATRPPSSGRPSDHQIDPVTGSTLTSPREAAAATTAAAVIGE